MIRKNHELNAGQVKYQPNRPNIIVNTAKQIWILVLARNPIPKKRRSTAQPRWGWSGGVTSFNRHCGRRLGAVHCRAHAGAGIKN